MDRIEMLLDLLEKNPNDPFTMYALALEYKNRGKLIQSERTFAQLLDESPSYLASYFHYAALLVEMEKEGKALNIYEVGLKLAKKKGEENTYKELKSAKFNLEISLNDL